MDNTKILLRFDDICPTMNWGEWNKAKDLLDTIGATALLGVIPDNHDPDLFIDKPREDFWEYIKHLQRQGYTIAMHGYQHVFDIKASGLSTPKKHSEFAGHTYEEQYKRIKRGKQILNKYGIETDIFFAPAHSYDSNTLKALAANGFKYISDGKSLKPYKWNGIMCFPEYTGGFPRIKTPGGYYTAVLHAHEWARYNNDYMLSKFRLFCYNKDNKFVTFEEYIRQEKGMALPQRLIEYLYVILVSVKHLLFK